MYNIINHYDHWLVKINYLIIIKTVYPSTKIERIEDNYKLVLSCTNKTKKCVTLHILQLEFSPNNKKGHS